VGLMFWNKKRLFRDEFIVIVGMTTENEKFVCATVRKGAKCAEPEDVHEIGRWIINQFNLKAPTRARINVNVELLEENIDAR
jgi:hypothetical protein